MVSNKVAMQVHMLSTAASSDIISNPEHDLPVLLMSPSKEAEDDESS